MTKTSATLVSNPHDYAVADIKLADYGRKEIAIAETEMPGLMATRAEYAKSQPLKGARIAGSLHMTIQTAVLIETLKALGADVRWASCNIYSTQDHAAAAIAADGTPVFAIKGESLKDYWDYTHRIFEWADGGSPNMILDDGGDATLLIHLGQRAEKGDTKFLDTASNEEEEVLYAAIKARLKSHPGWYGKNAKSIRGVTEETTTGVHRLYIMAKEGKLLWPAINVNDSVTKSKFDNLYGCRESLVDGIRRGTDVMMAGKVAMVAGFGDVGKGSAASLAQRRLPRDGLRGRSDLRASGGDGRLRGHDDGRRRAARRHFRHRDRQCRRHHPRPHARDARPRHRLQHRPLRFRDPGRGAAQHEMDNVKPQVDEIEFPDGKKIILLSEGRLVNLGNATGHPSFVMSASFTNQTLAQIELFTKPGQYEKQVYTLPKHLDEKVASLHLAKIGAKLTKMTPEQSKYLGVPEAGPFKAETYRGILSSAPAGGLPLFRKGGSGAAVHFYGTLTWRRMLTPSITSAPADDSITDWIRLKTSDRGSLMPARQAIANRNRNTAPLSRLRALGRRARTRPVCDDTWFGGSPKDLGSSVTINSGVDSIAFDALVPCVSLRRGKRNQS